MKTISRLASLLLIQAFSVYISGAESPPKANPQMQKVLDQLQELGVKPIETLSPQEARQQPSPADAVKALLKKEGKSTAPEPVANVQNATYASGDGEKIPARIYTPKGNAPFPVVLYIHGGGWVIADLDTYDASARALANAAGAVVFSAHYRQAPEHKFPASHQDTFAAYEWLVKNAGQIQGDPSKIAVVGESAGGNMAAGICIMARDKKMPLPVHQVLVYPVANNDFNTPSYQLNAKAKPLSKPAMVWFAHQEFNSPADGDNPLISLVDRASLEGLPSATVITDQIDPLQSEGQLLAQKLEKAGVSTRYRNFEGVTHEFFGMGAVLKESKEAVAFASEGLREAFAKAQSGNAIGQPPIGETRKNRSKTE